MTVFLAIITVLILVALLYLIYNQNRNSDQGAQIEQQRIMMDFSSRLSQEIQDILAAPSVSLSARTCRRWPSRE